MTVSQKSTPNRAPLYRASAILTVLIGVSFLIVGLVLREWAMVGVFGFIALAGIAVYPFSSRTNGTS